KSVMTLLSAIDKANGCVFGGLASGNESIMATAIKAESQQDIFDIQDQYIDNPELYRDSLQTSPPPEATSTDL
ncbi:hypothetical protein H4R34_005957, partial [Dimargaris verticillata]